MKILKSNASRASMFAVLTLFFFSGSYRLVKADPHRSSPALADTSTAYKVARDFYIDLGEVKKLYPPGYSPKWQIINNWATFKFEKENLMQGIRGNFNGSFAIGEYNGKAYLYFSNFLRCTCAAQLSPGSEPTVIGSQPTTFNLSEFYAVEDNAGAVSNRPCKGITMGPYDEDGWKIKFSLGVSKDLSLSVNAVVESLTDGKNHISRKGTNVSARWTSGPLTVENTYSPMKAIEDSEQKLTNQNAAVAAQKAKEAHDKQRELYDKKYEQMIVKVKAMVAAQPKTRLVYKGYNLKAPLTFAALIGGKVCEMRGMQIDELWIRGETALTYQNYLSEINRITAFKAADFEPHERDAAFVVRYFAANRYNKLLIEMAARYLICDREGVQVYTNWLDLERIGSASGDEKDNQESMLEFLLKKN